MGQPCDATRAVAVTRALPDMPSPTAEQVSSPMFAAIWSVIRTWDVNVPEFYSGYCGANGSHVVLIMDAVQGANGDR